jgi:hypothetical protein
VTADDTTRTDLTPDETKRLALLDAHAALGLLIGRVPMDLPVADWRIQDTGLDCMVSHPYKATDDDVRTLVRRLAKATGLEYSERRHNDSQNMVMATGTVAAPASGAEVPVRFWQLVKPCQCGCHHSAVTE